MTKLKEEHNLFLIIFNAVLISFLIPKTSNTDSLKKIDIDFSYAGEYPSPYESYYYAKLLQGMGEDTILLIVDTPHCSVRKCKFCGVNSFAWQNKSLSMVLSTSIVNAGYSDIYIWKLKEGKYIKITPKLKTSGGYFHLYKVSSDDRRIYLFYLDDENKVDFQYFPTINNLYTMDIDGKNFAKYEGKIEEIE